jgi:hypothetical protein
MDCLCVLFLGDILKHRPRYIIREYVGLKGPWEKTEEVNSMKACTLSQVMRLFSECLPTVTLVLL